MVEWNFVGKTFRSIDDNFLPPPSLCTHPCLYLLLPTASPNLLAVQALQNIALPHSYLSSNPCFNRSWQSHSEQEHESQWSLLRTEELYLHIHLVQVFPSYHILDVEALRYTQKLLCTAQSVPDLSPEWPFPAQQETMAQCPYHLKSVFIYQQNQIQITPRSQMLLDILPRWLDLLSYGIPSTSTTLIDCNSKV